MPFWDHVSELRRRVFVVLGAVAVGAGAGYVLFPYFFDIVVGVIGEDLYVTAITEGFLTRLRISILIGVFFSLPVALFEAVLFVFPALVRRERAVLLLALGATFALFVLGVAYAYRSVLPISIAFLKSREFFPEDLNRIISYSQFVTFFFQFLIGFGLCFQFPVVLLVLMKLDVFTVAALRRFFKYFAALAFGLSALITPPDVVSQILLAVPLLVLYGLCLAIGAIFFRSEEG
jgi:sec-independent protein translocase protein TatC